MRALLLALSLAACASVSETASTANVDVVIGAERAFAARGGEIGLVAAFREYTAPDGTIGNFDSAPETMAATPDQGARNLFWWPAFAGIALSGDLGFTTGPFSVDDARTPRGQYFTVWRRQPDGSWKWIWDGGAGPISDPGPAHTVEAVTALPVSTLGVGAAEARHQVEGIERSFRASTEVATYLAEDARVYRTGEAQALGRVSALNAIVRTDPRYDIRRIESSEAGDLVFVLGAARWSRDGQPVEGQFARMWQLRREGWRIVYDHLSAQAPR